MEFSFWEGAHMMKDTRDSLRTVTRSPALADKYPCYCPLRKGCFYWHVKAESESVSKLVSWEEAALGERSI